MSDMFAMPNAGSSDIRRVAYVEWSIVVAVISTFLAGPKVSLDIRHSSTSCGRSGEDSALL